MTVWTDKMTTQLHALCGLKEQVPIHLTQNNGLGNNARVRQIKKRVQPK